MITQAAFELLGITPDTNYKTGYNRFRYLAKKHHPDKGGDAEIFQQVYAAWQTVKSELTKVHLREVMLQKITNPVTGEAEYRRFFKSSKTNQWYGNVSYTKVGPNLYRMFPSDIECFKKKLNAIDRKLRGGVDSKIQVVGEGLLLENYVVWKIDI